MVKFISISSSLNKTIVDEYFYMSSHLDNLQIAVEIDLEFSFSCV